MGCEAKLIGAADEFEEQWLVGKKRVGITAGASAPERLVKELTERLTKLGVKSIRSLPGIEEHVSFPMPKGLSRRVN